jgi:hypothetical protein
MRVLIDRLKNLSGLGIAALIASLAFMGLVAFVLVARTINTTPAQCASCHPEMTALYREGKTHPVAQVTCHQCHSPHAVLPEGFNIIAYVRDVFIPEKYMASAERINGRCLECHWDLLGAEKEKGKLIKVNHKLHLAENLIVEGKPVTLGCVDCHSNVVHDRSLKPTNRPLMAGCFTAQCHVKDENKDSCLRCHYQVLIEKAVAAAQ